MMMNGVRNSLLMYKCDTVNIIRSTQVYTNPASSARNFFTKVGDVISRYRSAMQKHDSELCKRRSDRKDGLSCWLSHLRAPQQIINVMNRMSVALINWNNLESTVCT
mmetsp:Transcript_30881/g.37430  ORF Transcript_30881/g.37430 Transcript_30881/m.37430 type:complete len:107 (-) Transcript_30881:524-844(-)